MGTIKESLTFDDVLLIPRYSNVLPSETDISINLTNSIKLRVPFLSSAMDTVTESKMAIAMAKAGGIGIIHRNLKIKQQTKELIKVKRKKLIVGAAVGTSEEDLDRARALADNGCDLIVIDTAHGHSEKVLRTLSKLKNLLTGVRMSVFFICRYYILLIRSYGIRLVIFTSTSSALRISVCELLHVAIS